MAAEEQQSEPSGAPQDGGDAPASPPLPARHTAVTPGPRAARFQEMYGLALSHTLNKISYENFAACYPTIAAQAPGVLRQVQKQMVDRLGELCNKEFDLVLQNRSVVPKLNELESLVSDATRRKGERASGTAAAAAAAAAAPTPPHLLPADDVLAAHMAPHLASQQSQLNAKLQNMQADNVRLFEEIQAQRGEIEALLAAVEKVLADVDGANGLLDGVVEDLAKETRTVEVEMADS